MGRRCNCEDSVIVIFSEKIAASAVKKRKTMPELPALMVVFLGSIRWGVPVISRCVDFLRIFAPNCLQAWIIASESGEARA
ncbi:Uncharacterised protein [Mycoplasmopsis arginini]|nr:Uncharacterised protein [Mycoplasmopsis arginini]